MGLKWLSCGISKKYQPENKNPETCALTPMLNNQQLLMRTLFLIRHAKSSWDHSGLRDFDRPLNERGLHEAPLMAQVLVQAGIQPDLLVSSPAKRAWTTALFFATAFDIREEAVQRESNIYEADPPDILRLIGQLPDQANTVFLFGHNPTFTEVANRFAKKHIENVPTCGIVHIESEADSWAVFEESNATVRQQYFPKETL